MPDMFFLFVFFLCASVGLTSILVEGRIFDSLRNSFRERAEKIQRKRGRGKTLGWTFSEWGDQVLNCYQCCGFWCGVLCCLLLFPLPFWPYTQGVEAHLPGLTVSTEKGFSLLIPLRSLIFLGCCGCASSLFSVLFMYFTDLSRSVADYCDYRRSQASRASAEDVPNLENTGAKNSPGTLEQIEPPPYVRDVRDEPPSPYGVDFNNI